MVLAKGKHFQIPVFKFQWKRIQLKLMRLDMEPP